MLAGRLQRGTTTLATRMEDTVRVRLHLPSAPGSDAALCRGLRASSRRYHRPTGQIQQPERTQDWIKLGGKVRAFSVRIGHHSLVIDGLLNRMKTRSAAPLAKVHIIAGSIRGKIPNPNNQIPKTHAPPGGARRGNPIGVWDWGVGISRFRSGSGVYRLPSPVLLKSRP